MPDPVLCNQECAPDKILSAYPCLNCLSETDLQRCLFVLWAKSAGFDIPEFRDRVLDCSACFNPLSARQHMVAEVKALVAANNVTIEELLVKAKGLDGISPSQLAAAITYCQCQFWLG